jgi:hypothetical protein
MLNEEFELEGENFSDLRLIHCKNDLQDFNEISISNNSKISDRGLFEFYLPEKLTSLRIWNCKNLTDSTFKRVFTYMKKCTQLKSLEIGPLTASSLVFFIHALRTCPFNITLKKLKFEISRSAIDPSGLTLRILRQPDIELRCSTSEYLETAGSGIEFKAPTPRCMPSCLFDPGSTVTMRL